MGDLFGILSKTQTCFLYICIYLRPMLLPKNMLPQNVTDWSKWTNPRTSSHTHSIFSQLQLHRFLLPEMAGRGEAVSRCVSTHTNSQPGCGSRAGFGLGFAVSRCLADGHWAHREGGQELQQAFRTESEYTYYTEMLYEKPM